jgi:hypothetical protein
MHVAVAAANEYLKAMLCRKVQLFRRLCLTETAGDKTPHPPGMFDSLAAEQMMLA